MFNVGYNLYLILDKHHVSICLFFVLEKKLLFPLSKLSLKVQYCIRFFKGWYLLWPNTDFFSKQARTLSFQKCSLHSYQDVLKEKNNSWGEKVQCVLCYDLTNLVSNCCFNKNPYVISYQRDHNPHVLCFWGTFWFNSIFI